jgi:hypothetical protein
MPPGRNGIFRVWIVRYDCTRDGQDFGKKRRSTVVSMSSVIWSDDAVKNEWALYVRLAKTRAHRGSNTGPIDLQSIALPLSYTPIHHGNQAEHKVYIELMKCAKRNLVSYCRNGKRTLNLGTCENFPRQSPVESQNQRGELRMTPENIAGQYSNIPWQVTFVGLHKCHSCSIHFLHVPRVCCRGKNVSLRIPAAGVDCCCHMCNHRTSRA